MQTDFRRFAQAEHDAKNTHLTRLGEVGTMLNKFDKTLMGLTSLGPAVTRDDIINAVGQMTAAGADPRALAQIVSTMPPGGDALAQWVGQYHGLVNEAVAAHKMATVQAQHQLGVSALHSLVADHIGEPPQAQGAPAGPFGALPQQPGTPGGALPASASASGPLGGGTSPDMSTVAARNPSQMMADRPAASATPNAQPTPVGNALGGFRGR